MNLQNLRDVFIQHDLIYENVFQFCNRFYGLGDTSSS